MVRRLSRVLLSALVGAAVLALCSSRVSACSQCMCGTPFPSDVLGGAVPMQVRFGIEDRYLSKSNALDEGPGEEIEDEHRISPFALWRPNERATLLVRLPYTVKELTERPTGSAEGQMTAHGLSDLEVQSLIQAAELTGSHEAWLALIVGGTAPTGSNDARAPSGERLDAHLQPGIGAWSGTGGFHAALRDRGGVWDASLLDRWSGANRHGYRYGNALLYNAGFTTREISSWQLIAQLNGRTAARDRFEDGSLGENTGGTVLYVSPGVRWRGSLGVSIEGAVQIPVVESLNGAQDEHATGRLALSLGR